MDEQLDTPTCPECGCELQSRGPAQPDGHQFTWIHYQKGWDYSTNRWSIYDAKGHSCSANFMILWLSPGKGPVAMFTGPILDPLVENQAPINFSTMNDPKIGA